MAALGNVLVTGGAGFIGCALSQLLAHDADAWVALDNLHPQVHPTSSRPTALTERAFLVVGDVSEAEAYDRLGDFRPDTVIHLAAETGTGQSLTEATRHGMVNVVGTTQLTDWLARVGHRPSHVLLTSSRAVYGEGEWQREDGSRWYPGQRSHAQLESQQWDFPESRGLAARADLTAPAPTSVYGATKLTQEHILSAWALSNGVPLSIFRLQNVYGPGQSLTNSYTGIVTLFSRLARRHEAIPLYEDGDITRDFVFIDDVANALAAGLRQPPAHVRLLDVGSGVPTTIGDLAREMAKYHGAPEPVVVAKFRDGDVRHALADISRTSEALGWTPQVDVSAGVAKLQVWVEREEQELQREELP